MTRLGRYPPELRERAVRLVRERQHDPDCQRVQKDRGKHEA